jgi:hypothetical protein
MLAPQERIVIQDVRPGQSGSPGQYYRLKSRQEEIGNQLENVSERREELAQQALAKSGVDRAGLESRMKILDGRIEQLEQDLADVGRELAEAAPATLTQPPPRIIRQGYNDDDMMLAGVTGAAIAFALCIPIFIRSFKRRRFVPASMATGSMPALASERMDRMEQTIDSIAVEIERVSENQRFMTRLMTETQLAGTIAAVRGSTEAAKAAAENATNV